jgi:hypothetical protein
MNNQTAEITVQSKINPFLIALYLPQFHPIPENNEWWGNGFTEWTNVAKAKPLYKGHDQPKIPADLGFYDLRLAETREAQANLARMYGINAFCYYHYWFAGRQILERPFREVLQSGQPNFPFMLCWANETWSGIWHGAPNKILIEQTYPGKEDHIAHFNALLPAFLDSRYVKFDGRPVFVIWNPSGLPNIRKFIDLWQTLAIKSGLQGLYFVGARHTRFNWHPEELGLDIVLPLYLPPRKINLVNGTQYPTIYKYEDIYEKFLPPYASDGKTYPCLKPNWDNTPRSGVNGMVFEGSTPILFKKQLLKALSWSKDMPENNKVIFIKAWNEWAEGNILEPDLMFGYDYLKSIKEALDEYKK